MSTLLAVALLDLGLGLACGLLLRTFGARIWMCCAGAAVALGAGVALTILTGPSRPLAPQWTPLSSSSPRPIVAVPPVTGLSLPRARAELERVGLRSTVQARPTTAHPPGTVMGQLPAAFTDVDLHELIRLVVSIPRPTGRAASSTGAGPVAADETATHGPNRSSSRATIHSPLHGASVPARFIATTEVEPRGGEDLWLAVQRIPRGPFWIKGTEPLAPGSSRVVVDEGAPTGTRIYLVVVALDSRLRETIDEWIRSGPQTRYPGLRLDARVLASIPLTTI